MKKPVIIIADSDKFYVEALIWKFVETWGNKIELNVITEQEYFQDFFSTLQEADTVLVSAEMYTQELHRHEISKIIVLREDTDLPHPQPGILWMNKYANIKSIINEAMEECSVRNSQSENGNKDTRVIAVSSAIGGSGKTTISLGLALGLARQHKHVLYISTELSQSFRFFLKNKRTIGTGIFQSLQETREESTAF